MSASSTSDEAPADAVKPIVAMIHAGALPGTPGQRQSLDEIVATARREAWLYQEAGVNCLMIENMHDVPYLRGSVGPEIVASMTMIARAIRDVTDLPVGIQILAAADLEAMAVAHAAGLDFIRTECFSFAHVGDEGIMESNAAKLLRYRRAIGAAEVQVWADIKKKHASHAWTGDLTLGDVAEAAEFMGADAVIVTGASTGRPPQPSDVEEARGRCQLPVFVGSGASEENLTKLLTVSDGLIVGSHFKQNGHWSNAPDADRVRRFMAQAAPYQRGMADAAERPSSVTVPRTGIPPFPRQPRQ